MTDDGVISWVSGLTSIPGAPSPANRALFFGPSATAAVLARGGVGYPGIPNVLSTESFSTDYHVSRTGQHFIIPFYMQINAVLGITLANDQGMMVSGAGLLIDGQLVREDRPVPPAAGGLAGERWSTFGVGGVTDSGRYMFAADTTAAITQDDVVVIDGAIRLREGDSFDGHSLWGDPRLHLMNDNGDVVIVWGIESGRVPVLTFNRRILLREGDPVDLNSDGVVEPTSILRGFTGGASVRISGRYGPGHSRVRVLIKAFADTLGTETTSDDTPAVFTVVVCLADYNRTGSVNVQDIYDFLADWAAHIPAADFNADWSVTVQDIYDFLSAWNGGECP